MARIVPHAAGFQLLAVSAGERELLGHAQRGGGEVLLEGAAYAVRADRVLLPEGISRAAAARVQAAFEGAAEAHRLAMDKRLQFKIL